MNAVSSRSHAIFTVSLTQEKLFKEGTDESRRNLISKFHFVDLAGSVSFVFSLCFRNDSRKQMRKETERRKEFLSTKVFWRLEMSFRHLEMNQESLFMSLIETRNSHVCFRILWVEILRR